MKRKKEPTAHSPARPVGGSQLTAPKGFTLIELLVVMIIIAIVMAIGTNTYQSQREQVRYNDSILSVLNTIKTARDYALSSHTVFDQTIPDDAETTADERIVVPPEGYGVYLQRSEQPGESKIILFANTKADNPVSKNQYDPEEDMIIEEKKLDVNVIFTDILLYKKPVAFSSQTNPDENELVMIFRPPVATATLAANDHPLSEEDLTLPTDLYLEFRKLDSDPAIPSQYIHLSAIAGVAEIDFNH